jgi:hypothetical protein
MKLKTIVKIIVSMAIVIPAIGAMTYYAMNSETVPFESVCDPDNNRYTNLCDNVSKRARSTRNMTGINNTDYGTIIGVAWRQRGSIISSPGQELRYSSSNSYYYIISGDKKGYFFLLIASEVAAK